MDDAGICKTHGKPIPIVGYERGKPVIGHCPDCRFILLSMLGTGLSAVDLRCPHWGCNRTKLERDEADIECQLGDCPYQETSK